MLQIKIYNCTAVAENKNECASNEEIKKKLESPTVTYYTLKNYIDTNNYKNPYVRGLQETFYYVSYNRYISATEYLKHVQVHSDIGLLFSEEKINSDNTVDSMIDFFKDGINDGKIFTMTLQLTNKIDIYNRTYYKLQDLGADIGAVFGVMRIVFSFLIELYNTSKLFNSIINNYFLIKDEYKPVNKDKKIFNNLKSNFYTDFKLDISLERRNSINSQINENKKSDEYKKSSRNSEIIEENTSRTKTKNLLNIAESKNITIDKIISGNAHLKKNIKNEEEEKEKEKKIKLNFSYIDRLFCLYIIELCKKKVHKHSHYYLYYKGKKFLIKIFDVKNYLVIHNFCEMFFLLNGKEKREIFDYATTPILSTNYVGMRLGFENDTLF